MADVVTQSVESQLSGYIGESVTGAAWHVHDAPERDILTLMQRHDLPEIIARILVARKIDLEKVEDFLAPSLRSWLPDPMHLLDMDKAANRIAQAIINDEVIAILGDYDVDGATSTSLLMRYFASVGGKAIYHIPDRILEGYGPNSAAMSFLHERGAKICITVDCGTLAFEPLEHAANIGLEVIVIDHHLGAEILPKAHAVVNPNRLDELSEHGYMAAVGVAFLLVVAVQRVLQDKGFFTSKPTPDLLQLLDIVALGTVCDVVPLIKANRAFVAQGLKIMRKRSNIGLNALMDVSSMDEPPGVYHLGFLLGPRINAGGRVGKSDLGTQLLTTHDTHMAFELAQQLNHFNTERKAIEQQVLDEAIAQAEANGADSHALVMVAGEGWHPGVIGVVAGRLKERYHRPTAVISLKEGIGKASARSITGVDFGSAVVAATQAGILVAGGGHKMAAGFTVEQTKLETLREFLIERFEDGVKEFGQKRFRLDGYLTVSAISAALIGMIEKVGPFGSAHPEPCFVLPSVVALKVDIVGAQHLRVIIGDKIGNGKNMSIKAMAFRSVETPLGQTLLNLKGRPVHMAVKLRLNRWQGMNRPEVLIEDVML
jgi:single-stranded-DNA-specific exonuclease